MISAFGAIHCLFSFCCSPALCCTTTYRREKKSGVPYILTSYRRRRQTPIEKHDYKTRHVIAHAAQPSYSAFRFLTLAKFPVKRHTLLRTSTGVATRPWQTPLPRAAGPGLSVRPGVWKRTNLSQGCQYYTELHSITQADLQNCVIVELWNCGNSHHPMRNYGRHPRSNE